MSDTRTPETKAPLNQTSLEHRLSVLTKVENYLIGVVQNVQMQQSSEEQKALEIVMQNIHDLISTMRNAKGDEEFKQAVTYVDDVLQKQFFEKIYKPTK